MCKDEDIKAKDEFLNGNCSPEEYVERLDPRGASVTATGMISRQVRELKDAVFSKFTRDTEKERENNEKAE